MKLTVRGMTGPVVVKLSGIAGGTGLYREEMEAAAASGFRVVALDSSGDRWDDPAPGPLTWDGFAAEVEAAIASTGEGRAILWGTSFGCLLALAAAVRHPERVRGLLLCHPPDPLYRPRRYVRLLEWAEGRARPDLVARLLFSAGFLSLTSWEGLAPKLWVRVPSLLSASVEAATPAATVRRKLDLLFRDDPGVPSVPVEIIAGSWDLVAPLAGARCVARRCSSARITVIGFSGHAGAYSRPLAYRRAFLGALSRLSC